MRKAVFVDLPNFYSRLLKSGLGEPRELRDYFLHWLDLDLVSKWLAGEFCPTWVFYSGRRFGPSSERIEGQHLAEYIKRISRLISVTPYNANIDYVTPQQAHQGLRQKIVDQRRDKKLSQRNRRREENQKQKSGVRQTNENQTTTASLVV